MQVRTTPPVLQRQRPLSIAVAGALVVLSGACTQSPTRSTPQRSALQVDIYPRVLQLDALGEGRTLGAAISAPGSRASAPVWTVLDTTVATIDGVGHIRAVGNGSTRVVAQVNGKTDTAQVTVTQKAVKLTITPSLDTIRALGATERLVATGTDRNGNTVMLKDLTWSSSAPSIVSIDADGVARGLSQGTGRVRATSANLKGDAKIVVAPAVAAIRISPAEVSVKVGDTLTLVVTATDSLGNATTTPQLAWSSADSTVASVRQGVVTGRGAGSTTIGALSGNLVSSVAVSVSSLLPSPVTPRSKAIWAIRCRDCKPA